MAYRIRPATPGDAAALLDVYRPYIDTPVTFEYPEPAPEVFARRVEDILAMYPYIVCLDGERIVGYAYAHRLRERQAYDWTAELSVYLDEKHTGHGIGPVLYDALLELLRMQGVHLAIGCVAMPNEASHKLHEACGFEHVATTRHIGYKLGAWRDVAWYEKLLCDSTREPKPVTPFARLPRETVSEVLKKAEEGLQA